MDSLSNNVKKRLIEVFKIIKESPSPISLKEIAKKMGLKRNSLVVYVQILEEKEKISKFTESTPDYFQRHSKEGLHPHLGRKCYLYEPKLKDKKR